ncbi:MAG: radical SAM protein [bacterium]
MRIRLIQPPLVQPRYRQLTLPVVGAELAAQGLDVQTSDENVEDVDLSGVDLVGITCHVYNAPRAFELARSFRLRGIPVILGGTFPTVAPELVAPHCDSVVVGELEGQAAELVGDARAGRLKPRYQAETPPSLAHTVRPDFSLLRSDRYLRFNFPLEVSRGCRFRCTFCTTHTLFPKPRTRSLADIERDLGQHDHGQVELIDVNFLNDPAFFKQVVPLLGAADIPGWFGQTTVWDLADDPALPELFAASRCRALFVGLETVTQEGLRSLHKQWSRLEAFRDVVQRYQDAGILIQAGLIVGLDSDDPDVLARTADLLEKLRVHTASVTFLHFYPGTKPYETLRREGRLLTEDWRDLDGNRPTIRPTGMSVDSLKQEVRRFLERMYSVRSIARRGRHRGTRRFPSQLAHHLAINTALRTYYKDLVRDWDRGPAAEERYMQRPPESRTEQLVANTSTRLIERLWKR